MHYLKNPNRLVFLNKSKEKGFFKLDLPFSARKRVKNSLMKLFSSNKTHRY
jgi:hypothetical protein